MSWVRVSKNNRCPHCQKFDWCRIFDNGVECMRTPSAKIMKSGGWWHPNDAPRATRPALQWRPAPPTIDCEKLMAQWHGEATQAYADSLGVSLDSLKALQARWSGSEWAFPMFDGNCRIVGIRLRNDTGRKWAVTGSHQGVFVPAMPVQSCVWLPEGPTDTAAALTVGLYAIGRPSCQCGGREIAAIAKKHSIREAVIVSDNDTPGLRGAEKLQIEIGIPSCIVIPPAKDLREFVRLGATKEMVQDLTKGQVWNV